MRQMANLHSFVVTGPKGGAELSTAENSNSLRFIDSRRHFHKQF